MAAAAGRRTVTLGGKGSSLTSSSVFDVSNGFAHIAIGSSAVSRPCSSSSSSSGAKFSFSIPDYFTAEEARASVILLLNKFLISSSSSACAQLVEILEQDALSSDYSLSDVAPGDLTVLNYSDAAIDGVAAILDHRYSSLASVADAVAALSCEPLRADASPFSLMDSGDGSSAKDAVAVASDFEVFFNGSKLVNSGRKLSDSSLLEIPSVHGDFREISRSVHSKTRLQLNSGFRAGSAKVIRLHCCLCLCLFYIWGLTVFVALSFLFPVRFLMRSYVLVCSKCWRPNACFLMLWKSCTHLAKLL